MTIRAVDLTQPMGILTPPFPGGRPMRIVYTNRISGDGYGQQEYTFTTHTGTHLDGPMHFDPKGGVDLQYDSCCEALGKKIGEELS